jgi:hypothetical protein
MILLCGIRSEPPLDLVQQRLEALGTTPVVFHQRDFERAAIEYEICGGGITGELRLNGQTYPLEEIDGVYTRLMDDQNLPELRGEPPGSPRRQQARALHDALLRWSEIAPARVVNRSGPMGSNFSKPFQAQLIRAQGFAVPETLITNDPERVLAFHARHGRIIYKSISGVRSIVCELGDRDIPRLDRIRWCPTQFQQFVDGTNVRVHTVGNATFATAIRSEATDYRYARQQADAPAELEPIELPAELTERCVRLSRSLRLDFAGIDLKLTPDGEAYCFEVNPCPAFSYYELNTGQPISLAVARYLLGLDA